MKRSVCALLAVVLLFSLLPLSAMAADAVNTSDPAAALDEFLALDCWETDEEEGSERKGETIYPEEFAGMYVDETGALVVCLTKDTPEIEDTYRALLPHIDGLVFQTVSIDYNTLQHYMLVIAQRHVSSNLLVVNMYKIKDYGINFEENRIDIRLYSDQEAETVDYLHSIFGDGIFLYFTDTTGELDKYDETGVPTVEAAEDSEEETVSFSEEVSQKAEESGFSAGSILLPVAAIAVILAALFVFSKVRSRKTNFDDEDYIDK